MRYALLLSGLLLAAVELPAQVDLIIPVGRAGAPPAYSLPLTRLVDLNRDGVYAQSSDLFAFQEKIFSLAANNCFIMDLCVIEEGGRVAFYMTDSGNSTLGECFLIRSVDANGDGRIQDSETRVWVDFGRPTGSGNSPDGVAAIRDALGRTVVYTTNDAGGMTGLWRSVDLNANGDAMDPGETIRWASAADLLTLPGPAGPVSLSFSKLQMVRPFPRGGVVAFQGSDPLAPASDDCLWIGLTEDANAKPVARNFLNPSSLNKAHRNQDFASGKLVDVDVNYQVTDWSCDLVHLAVAPMGFKDRDAFYFATSNSVNGRTGDLNRLSQKVSGLVFRGVDLDDDGDLDDGGEMVLFFNGSGAPLPGGSLHPTVQPVFFFDNITQSQTSIVDGIDGISVVGNKIYVIYEAVRRQPAILELEDLNNNNLIETGEARQVFWVDVPYPPVYSSQRGPQVSGLVALPAGLLAEPQGPGLEPFGTGCLSSFEWIPLVWASGAPVPGNAGFSLNLTNGPAGGAGWLFFGLSETTLPGVGGLPFDLTLFGLPGCFFHTDIVTGAPFNLDAAGWGRFPLPLPASPALQGLRCLVQPLLVDPLANPAGLVTSGGLRITVQ